jgi:hypothetical protein
MYFSTNIICNNERLKKVKPITPEIVALAAVVSEKIEKM